MRAQIFRFLTMEKFNWLIDDNGLYVGAAAHQTDKKEGIYDFAYVTSQLKESGVQLPGETWDTIDWITEQMMLNNTQCNYLSSWYLGHEETQKMWEEYGLVGVVLVSAPYLLAGLPEPVGNASNLYAVTYDSEAKDKESFEPLRFKEGHFEHESEYRLVVNMRQYSLLTGFESDVRGAVTVGGVPSYESPEITICMSKEGLAQSHNVIRRKGLGYVIDYDLERLVQEIRLHPDSTEEKETQVKELLAKKGLNIPVRRSTLAKTS